MFFLNIYDSNNVILFFPFLKKNYFPSIRLKIVPDHTLINPLEKIALNGCVTGLGCIESAYMVQCTPCIKDVMHPDKAALLVYLQYLTQLEVIQIFFN